MRSWEGAASAVFHAVRLDPIRRKILVFALLATLIPSLSLGWRSYTLNKEFITQKLSEELRDATSGTVREVSLWLKERLYEVRVFSSSYEVTENLERLRAPGPEAAAAEARRRLTEYLTSVQGKFRDYEELLVADASGRALVTSAGTPGPPLPAEALAGVRADAPVVGNAYWDDARRKVVLPVAVPVVATGGRRLGLMVGTVSLGPVQDILRTHAPGRTGQASLVTADGVVVVGSRASGTALGQVRLAAGTVRDLAGQPGIPLEYTNDQGRPVIGVLRPLPHLAWSAVADVTRAEAYDQVNRTRTLTLATVAALLLGIGLTAYVVGLTVVRPLERLTDAATRVAAGDLDVALPVVAHGEVGSLTRVFNYMVKRLGEARGELATANAALSEKNEALQKLSITDSLTGLYNRRHLTEVLATEVARARRFNHQFAILMVDIDHFKRYNDTHGHLAGDRLLARIAGLFQESIRGIDYAARYGGEEFLLLLHESGPDGGEVVAERIRARVAAAPLGEQPEVVVTISVGVAAFPVHGDGPEALIARADAALYEAKGRGRNRVVVAGRLPDRPPPA